MEASHTHSSCKQHISQWNKYKISHPWPIHLSLYDHLYHVWLSIKNYTKNAERQRKTQDTKQAAEPDSDMTDILALSSHQVK